MNINNCGLYNILKEKSERNPDKIFLTLNGQDYNYKNIIDQVDIIGSNLHELNLKKGDKVAVLMDNCFEFIILYFALAKLGLILIPLSLHFSDNFIFEILKNVHISMLVISDSCLKVKKLSIKDIIDIAPLINIVVNVGNKQKEVKNFEELICNNKNNHFAESYSYENDPFVVIFTSGSTGVPKGVVHSQKNILLNGSALINRLGLNDKDVFLFPFPMTSIFGIGWLAIALLATSRVILMRSYNTKEALELIEKYKITIHNGNSSMFLSEIHNKDLSLYNISSLRLGIIGGHVIGKELLIDIKEKLGMKACRCYGMTEAAGAITLVNPNDNGVEWLETAGKPVKGVQIKIVDIKDKSKSLSREKIGEICCNAEFFSQTYLIDGKMEAIKYSDGWFHTDDIGYIDTTGCLNINGRKNDIIKLNDKLVFIQDIEKYLDTHDSIINSTVLTIDKDLYIFIIKKNSKSLEKNDVISYLFSRFNDSIFVKSIIFVDKFPLTVTGKIDKIELQKICTLSFKEK